MWVWDLLKLIFSPNTISLPAKTNAQRLYDTAFGFIGKDASPKNLADSELACAESVSNIIQKAFPELQFPTFISTRTLYSHLTQSPSWKMVSEPKKGDVIISVTTRENGVVNFGHCGITGRMVSPDRSLWIMSNRSSTGTFEVDYTVNSWLRYFKDRKGLTTVYFTPL